jgi:hypothetical protein
MHVRRPAKEYDMGYDMDRKVVTVSKMLLAHVAWRRCANTFEANVKVWTTKPGRTTLAVKAPYLTQGVDGCWVTM